MLGKRDADGAPEVWYMYYIPSLELHRGRRTGQYLEMDDTGVYVVRAGVERITADDEASFEGVEFKKTSRRSSTGIEIAASVVLSLVTMFSPAQLATVEAARNSFIS